MKMGMTGEMNRSASGRYAPVNGLSMYYEIHGAGRPLVLLHGALTTIEGSFGRIPAAVELQALSSTTLRRDRTCHNTSKDPEKYPIL